MLSVSVPQSSCNRALLRPICSCAPSFTFLARSLPVPHSRNLSEGQHVLHPLCRSETDLGMPHLLLQLEDAVHERLRRWRAPGHIDIHRHDPIASSRHRIAVMIVATAICAAAHRNNPSRLWHLVIDLPQSRGHLVRQCARHNHNVRLTRRRAKDYTQSILVVARCRQVHHLHGTAGESKRHGPKRSLPCPIRNLIECRSGRESVTCPVHMLVACPWPTNSAYCARPFLPSWLGSGTSCRFFFIGIDVPGPVDTSPGLFETSVLAWFVEDVVRKAEGAPRRPIKAVVGFAVMMH